MKKVFTWLIILILLTGSRPVEAQEPAPGQPVSPRTPLPLVSSKQDGGAAENKPPAKSPDPRTVSQDQSQGFLADLSTQLSGTVAAPATTSGPDDFGYTWDDSIPFNWIDATDGIDSGVSGDDAASAAIDIGFSFPFYENSYPQLFFNTNGLIIFDPSFPSFYNIWIPDSLAPNNFIAAFWDDLCVGSPYNSGKIYYKTVDTGSGKLFVVEWWNVSQRNSSNLLTFEAILSDNGNILLQYLSMNGDVTSATIGIETADGFDGLQYLYNSPGITNSKAVQFYCPPLQPLQARVRFSSKIYGQFPRGSNTATFSIPVHNNGTDGSDIYNLDIINLVKITFPWTVNLYQADGVTLLTDTNGDGIIDTGSIDQGSSKMIVVKMQPPANADIGSSTSIKLTATSSRNSSVKKSTVLQTAIPASFARVYWDGNINIGLAQAGSDVTNSLGSNDVVDDTSIQEMPGGNFFMAWSSAGCIDMNCNSVVWEIYYALTDSTGNIVSGPIKLTDNSGASWTTEDYLVALSVAPNGKIGLLWRHYEYNSGSLSNIYFALLNSNGSVAYGPTNITNNSIWGSAGPSFWDPTLTSTTDNHFELAWRRETQEVNGFVDDIYYAIKDNNGNDMKAITRYTSDTAGDDDGWFTPHLTRLANNKILATIARGGNYGDIFYGVLDSNGKEVAGLANLTADGTSPVDRGPAPAAQLSNGKILISWISSSIRYAVLTNSFGVAIFPTNLGQALENTSAYNISVTADTLAHGIITWQDSDNSPRRLYYALVLSSGAITTPPMTFMSDDGYGIFGGAMGNWTTAYTPAARISVTPASQQSLIMENTDLDFPLDVQNLGGLGDDTFNLAPASNWPVAFYDASGTVVLSDTNGDGIIDTGPISQGFKERVIVRISAGPGQAIGAYNTTQVTLISAADAGVSKTAKIVNAIPAPFAQIYYDQDGGMGLYRTQGIWQDRQALIPEFGFNQAIIELPSHRFGYFWSTYRCPSVGCSVAYIQEIKYTIMDRDGNMIIPVHKIADFGDSPTSYYDEGPAVAVTPAGDIALTWVREAWNASNQFNDNVFLAIMNEDGDITEGPFNLTDDSTWGDSSALLHNRYEMPAVTVADDSHVIYSWTTEYLDSSGPNCTSNCSVSDIYYGVQTVSGKITRPNTRLTNDTPGPDQSYAKSNLTRLSGNRVLIAWECHNPPTYNYDICYSVMSSNMGMIKAITNLSNSPGFSFDVDAVQLPNDMIVLAWDEDSGGTSRIAVATLNGTYHKAFGPTILANPDNLYDDVSPSVTSDGHNHAILTWGDYFATKLYYALVDGNANVITPPLAFMTSHYNLIMTSASGFGNTTLTPYATFLSGVVRHDSDYFIGSYESEPNNTYYWANGYLHSGQNYYGHHNDSDDFFKIRTTAVGTISVNLSNFTGTGGQVLLYDSGHSLVGFCSAPSGSCSINRTNEPIGEYFIRIYSVGNFNTADWYTLNVTFP